MESRLHRRSKIVKYQINPVFLSDKITTVAFERETDKFYIYESGERVAKSSQHSLHFDTWQEAKDKLVELQIVKVGKLQAQCNLAKKLLSKLREMEEGGR